MKSFVIDELVWEGPASNLEHHQNEKASKMSQGNSIGRSVEIIKRRKIWQQLDENKKREGEGRG